MQTDERLVAEQVQAARSGAEGKPPATVRAREASQERPASETATSQSSSKLTRTTVFGLDEHLLGNLLLRPDLLAHVNAEIIGLTNSPLSADDFEGGENRAILSALQAQPEPGAETGIDHVLDNLPEAVQERCLAWIDRIKRGPSLSDDKLLKELVDTILRLRARHLYQSTHRLQFIILESETSGERQQLEGYKTLMLTYAAQERRLQRLLHSRTMTGSLNKDNGTL